MRKTHPNMFLATVITGVFSLGEAGIIWFTSPRLPQYIPPWMLGAAFAIIGTLDLMSAFDRPLIRVGKAALGGLIFVTFVMAVGLTVGYFQTPQVTASLDRPWGYLYVAARAVPLMLEPINFWRPKK